MATIIKDATEIYNAINNETNAKRYDALVAQYNDIVNSTLSRYEAGEFTYDEMLQFFGVEG